MVYVMGSRFFKKIKTSTINDEILIPKELKDVPVANWRVLKFDLIESNKVYRFSTEEDAKVFIDAVKNLVEKHQVQAESALRIIEGVGAIKEAEKETVKVERRDSVVRVTAKPNNTRVE